MINIFHLFKISFPAFIKIPFKKDHLAFNNSDTKIEFKEHLGLPKTFDFIAYFDDIELENNPNDIADRIPHLDVNTEIICLPA